MFGWFKRFGPGLLVTAAFVGPGTLTTASRAGARFGFSLLWAVLFSIVATIVLQEMAARLGLLSRQGLGEAIRSTFDQPVTRFFACSLVVGAIGVGNAAYQAGNITGATIGLSQIAGPTTPNWVWSVLVGAAALALLSIGRFKLLERVLIALVALMSAVFMLTACYVGPSWSEIAKGLFYPRIPAGSELTVIALIGTTVVPYNLFLHASSVQQQWPSSVAKRQALREARTDTVLSIALGGLITLAIVATAAAFYRKPAIDNAGQMARGLEPLLGWASRYFFAAGILAAGLTSAICAPLAAAYATSGVLGWNASLTSWRFRAVWATVLLIGVAFACSGYKPADAIVFAQAANGLLLPLVAVFLLVVMNRRGLLGEYTNGPWANLLGAGVTIVAAGLGGYKVWTEIVKLWR